MFALTIIAVIVLIIVVVIYLEYKNEKNYQEERRKREQERKKTRAPYDPKNKIQKPHLDKQERSTKRKAAIPGSKEKIKPKAKKRSTRAEEVYDFKDESKNTKPEEDHKTFIKEEVSQAELNKPEVKPQRVKKAPEPKRPIKKEEIKEEKRLALPKCEYPPFSYARLIDMGLSEEEAIDFTKELIPQINAQIPLIEEAYAKKDFHSMERLTHSIKGSSTTVGTGGVSDLLIECNTYLKTGKELPVAEAYIKHLKHYAAELEKQFA